jgi:hypothetical protein
MDKMGFLGISANRIVSIIFLLIAILISLMLSGVPFLVSKAESSLPTLYENEYDKELYK